MAERGAGEASKAEGGGAGDRASALAAAILRVSESLDFAAVLREIVEGARKLTGARLGIAATLDGSGFPGEHVFSGFTPEGELAEWPDGLGMVEHLNGLPGALRVADLPGYTRSVGLTPLRASQGRSRARRCATGARASATFSSARRRARRSPRRTRRCCCCSRRRRRPRSATPGRTSATGGRGRTSRRSSRLRRSG